jgi:DNA-binding NarL/FixJ family response regulator
MIQRERIRIVVVQGFCLLRNLLIERLEKEPWIEVCAVASGVEAMPELVELHRPHVLVMNVSLKCSAGLASLRKLKRDYFGLSTLAFSCDTELEGLYAGQALRAGADGYISAVDTLEDLVRAIWSVRAGERFVSHRTMLNQRDTLEQEKVLAGLSRREAEVFCLTGCGYVTQRIAEMMNLSVKTVESYRERIRKKMNLSSGADLLFFSTSLMRSAARRGVEGPDHLMVKELLLAKG